MIERATIERGALFLAVALLLVPRGLAAQAGAMPGRQPGGTQDRQPNAMQGMHDMQGMMGGDQAMAMGGMMQMMSQGMMGAGMMGPGMMGMMGQGVGMMSTGGPGPAAILGMADALDLTADQRSRLQTIQDAYGNSIEPLMARAMEAQARAAEALQGDSPDFDAYESALREGTDQMIQAHVAMARAAFEARQVLTDEQRARLRGGMQMMQGMMGQGAAGGGGMTGPMGSGSGR
jgi:Spy/CpxP family protein refolding chaperone